MPRRCSIYGCRTNYDGEERAATFSLPKDEELRDVWLRIIPTDLSHIKNPGICIKHFSDDYIIRKDVVFYKGELKEYNRDRVKLTEDAVPTLFPSCSSLLSDPAPRVRKRANVETNILEAAINESLEIVYSEPEIASQADIINFLEQKRFQNKWINYVLNDNLYICMMDLDKECPFVSGSISVSADLNVNVFLGKTKVPLKRLPLKQPIITTFNELESLISFVDENVKKVNPENNFEFALDVLKATKQYEESDHIKFCVEQIILSRTQKQSLNRRGSEILGPAQPTPKLPWSSVARKKILKAKQSPVRPIKKIKNVIRSSPLKKLKRCLNAGLSQEF